MTLPIRNYKRDALPPRPRNPAQRGPPRHAADGGCQALSGAVLGRPGGQYGSGPSGALGVYTAWKRHQGFGVSHWGKGHSCF